MLIFTLKVLNNILGSIRAVVIYNQDMEIGAQTEYRADNSLDVFLLVIGWYND